MNPNVVVAVVMTFVVTSLFWLGGVLALYFLLYAAAPPFQVALDYPSEVTVGDEFIFQIDIASAGDEEVTVGSIDIFDSLLSGFEIVEVNPPYARLDHTFNFQTIWFGREVAHDDILTVALTLRALEPGRYNGQLDVCTPVQRYTTVYADISVVQPE